MRGGVSTRILVISPAYPKINSNACAFVHARAKIYEKNGQKVKVFVPSESTSVYEFENVSVYNGKTELFKTLMEDFDPDIVAIHAPYYLTIKDYVRECKTPIVVWIHGGEVLFHFLHHDYAPWDIKSKLSSIMNDIKKVAALRYFMPKSNAVIYVSKWMKVNAERYLLFKHPFSSVIPNPVDIKLFSYQRKSEEIAQKGLSVRNLGWKYGLDIAIRAYSNLKKTSLTILGKGELENYLRNLAQKCRSDVSFITTVISHNKMPDIYTKFGYHVTPSRTEAQGVAMCEAMACGLPVVATQIGGIPEFVTNEVNGLLVPPEKPLALRNTILRLLSDERLYTTLSENGAKFVEGHLSSTVIYAKEFSVFKRCVEEFSG